MSRTLRLPILILLPVLLVLAVVVESRSDSRAPSDLQLSELTPTAASPGTLSSTWYCAAGSATGVASGEGAGPAEQRVIVANASDTAATGVLTVYPEGGEPTTRPIEVGAHARTEVVVSEVATAPWAAAMVEISGGEVTVAHELTGPTGRSVSDCSSTPSSSWYFPGGTTRVDTTLWLALFNPFPGEATVDLSFDTPDGARTPQEYQGIVVPGGSVVVEEVSAVVTLRDQLSTTVSVRSGRVIAEQVQSLNVRDGGTKGLSAVLGATEPSPAWSFPMGLPEGAAASETVAVFNPGESDTDVLVQVQLDDPTGELTVEPFEVSVPAHRYTLVDVTGETTGDKRVPEGVGHWVVVRSTDGSDIVAQRTLAPSSGEGFSSTVGLPVLATRWLAPVGSATGTTSAQLSVANPSPDGDATVSLRRIGGGQAGDVADATEVVVAPGGRRVIDLEAAGFTADDIVEISSDVPVSVGQWFSFSEPADVATPVAIPVAGTQSVLLEVVAPAVSQAAPSEDQPGSLDAPADPSVVEGGGTTLDTAATTTTAAAG